MITYLTLELKSPQPLPCLTDTCVVSSNVRLQLRSPTMTLSLHSLASAARPQLDNTLLAQYNSQNNSVHSVHSGTSNI